MSHILITDDNSDYRQSVIEILGFEGYDMLEAADGLQAINLIRAEHPDLILCDIDMPMMDGFEVLRMVKADSQLATIPFILVTARADATAVEKGQNLGADDYIIKPMNIALLLQKIMEHLARRRPQPLT